MRDVPALADYLSGGTPEIDLDRAALDLAAIEFPGLDPGPSIAALETIAADLRARLTGISEGLERVSIANDFLFGHLGFHGNETDYYNPRNSCLNEVLDSRAGIPITLSLLYMEVARRAGLPVYGIALPGHFIVQYDDGQSSLFIDPFHGGRVLSREDCLAIVREHVKTGLPEDAALFAHSTKRQILIRMLYNLRGAYLRLHSLGRAVEVLNLLILANPASPEERKERGLIQLHLRKLGAAAIDFHEYLRLSPQAADRGQIKRQLEAIHRFLGTLN